MDELKLSVVVPCFNEEDGILELYRRVTDICQNCVGSSFELVLINDGSKDNTWNLMRNLSIKDERVVSINLSRNYGHQLALSSGLKLCSGKRILVLDADLQDPPELLHQMMELMDQGFDVVYGQRIKREGETVFKKGSAFLFYRLLNKLVDIDIPEDTGDFRLMTRRVVDILNAMPENHRFIRGMISWIGLKQIGVSYERAARFAGETKYPMSKMLRFAIDAITGFSIRPLRIASYMGFLFGLLALVLMLYVIIEYFLGRTVTGWASLAVIILAIGAAQLAVLGILGEYFGRMYLESKRRPLYLIDEVVKANHSLKSAKHNVLEMHDKDEKFLGK